MIFSLSQYWIINIFVNISMTLTFESFLWSIRYFDAWSHRVRLFSADLPTKTNNCNFVFLSERSWFSVITFLFYVKLLLLLLLLLLLILLFLCQFFFDIYLTPSDFYFLIAYDYYSSPRLYFFALFRFMFFQILEWGIFFW